MLIDGQLIIPAINGINLQGSNVVEMPVSATYTLAVFTTTKEAMVDFYSDCIVADCCLIALNLSKDKTYLKPSEECWISFSVNDDTDHYQI